MGGCENVCGGGGRGGWTGGCRGARCVGRGVEVEGGAGGRDVVVGGEGQHCEVYSRQNSSVRLRGLL